MHKKHVELLFNIEIRNDFDEFEAMNIYFKDVNSSICVESPCYAFTVGAIQSEVSLERFIFSIDREKYRQDILHTLDMIDQVLVTVALQGNSVEIHCSDGNLHLTENATLLLDNFVQLAFLSNSVATMGEDWLSYKLNHTILQTITTLGKPIKRRTRILYCREEILTCPYSAVDGVFSILDIKGKHADNVTLYWEEMNKNITMPRGAFLIKGNYLLHCKKYGDMLNDLTIELDIHNIIQQYLGIGGVSLSIMCLFTALIGYCRMKQRFSLPFYVMINMCVSLMGAQLLFLTSQSVVGIKILCKAFAVAQHYFWLSAFLWMKIYSVSLTHLFISMVEVKHLSNNSVRVRCFVYAWGGPLIICLVCTILDVFTNHFIYGWDVFDVGSTCWIQPPLALVFSLALPLSLVMLINAVCLAIVIRIMVTPREVHDQANRRNSVLISVKLSAIMGFSWLFGLLANIDGLWFLSYGFVVLSSLQGVMILLIFGGNMYQQYRKGKMKQKFSLQRSALENL